MQNLAKINLKFCKDQLDMKLLYKHMAHILR